MSLILTLDDITSRWDGQFDATQTERAIQIIEDVTAIALQVAPGLGLATANAGALAAARAILSQAVIRALKSDNGQLASQSVGPWSMTLDTRNRDGWSLLTRTERSQLVSLSGQRAIRSFRLVSTEPTRTWPLDEALDVPPSWW